jgi:hypothetical protein
MIDQPRFGTRPEQQITRMTINVRYPAVKAVQTPQ